MSKKILFAEDNSIQGVVLKRLLTSRGFVTEWGKNGKEALKLLENFSPDLIITDVEMPEMDGFEFCKAVKSHPEYSKIPLVICSSLSEPEDIIRGIEVGANGYVTKPYDETFLMYRIDALLNNPIENTIQEPPVQIHYAGREYQITADKMHILQMLLSIYENTIKQNKELMEAQIEIRQKAQALEKSLEESERLLRNILPEKIADRLKHQGYDEPEYFSDVSVLFTDFKGFTDVAEFMKPKELVEQLDLCFAQFDAITEMYNLEKLKTIGDSYMAAGGLPEVNSTHPVDTVRAAMEIKDFMETAKSIRINQGLPYWELRIGIHSGPVVAGVIGNKKFAYDMWGDTVNTASRMESSGEIGKVNISRDTYEAVKEFFDCEYRGKIEAKNKGTIDMFFVQRIKPELSRDEEGKIPNDKFMELYTELKNKVITP
ncbi:adenylate/guanylate cyclase domain-containing protein [Leptospira idonii]|uniref:Adenylate/guanylate cyclase domain-containing response regulator n=1 Tax=Leptospira idonii TaxID=1193500 RepID=A0A4R9LY09_9LEPT|nr:adenylate/guanylate cyclase domain-containing protein [Leptospira idonii]TGN18325.1 adenylate/guanylate cyclase domain-containing response regulator [Leptospira idonii]